MEVRKLIWDVPTRVFHWLLVASFAVAFLTSESEHYRDIHVVMGYTLLGLIAFRLVWGFIGTRYAQFKSFLFSPAETAKYLASMLKGHPKHYPGHNPAGSLAVFTLLGLGIVSGVSGVLLFQDIGGEALEELHEMASYGMLTVVALHVAGVLASSLLHRENLVRAMITGYKSAQTVGERGIGCAYTWLGAIILVIVLAFWIGFPATGLIAPISGDTESQQHDD
ncbi:MAG: cytochrome b/b6 domain-containing protein [Gallionella sp.]|jgi:cytochrome b